VLRKSCCGIGKQESDANRRAEIVKGTVSAENRLRLVFKGCATVYQNYYPVEKPVHVLFVYIILNVARGKRWWCTCILIDKRFSVTYCTVFKYEYEGLWNLLLLKREAKGIWDMRRQQTRRQDLIYQFLFWINIAVYSELACSE